MTDRKKPGVAFWSSAVMVVLVLYVLSIGPLYWATEKWPTKTQIQLFGIYVCPAQWEFDHAPSPVGSALHWYVGLWVD
jgi:hypothetical protein